MMTASLSMCSYLEQTVAWPQSGRHILAQFDADSIYVYQAYRESIARYAVEHQQFGGDFSYSRMSWIKPNFLWMMYRAGWATKPGQEWILAIRLQRSFFDDVLTSAIASSCGASGFTDDDEWKQALAESEVRLQWDPDHDPHGNRLERRAIQLGLRGEMLTRYGRECVLSVEDITSFVFEQRENLQNGFVDLLTPAEAVYPVESEAGRAIGIELP